jgi:cold-inducible RNA-binding protein
MGNRLYIGNLSYHTTDAELRQEFGKCGTVTDAKVVTDRETGRSRGFGFVQYTTEGEANTAIQALHGSTLGGRQINVTIAEERSRSGGPNRSGGVFKAFSGTPAPTGGSFSPGPGGSGGGDRGRSGRGGGKSRRRRDREDNDCG